MSNNQYDLIVLGAGSGGLAGSKRAASYGAKTAIVEDDRVGGTCVIRGCIPKKLMVYAAHFSEQFEYARGYGWSVGPARLDWPALVAARDAAVRRLETTHEEYLEKTGVTLLRGRAQVADAHSVTVGGREYHADKILIATGGRPVLPQIPGGENALTSDGFFALHEQPDHVVLVGGGYIAVELASILRGLGSRVTVVIRRELPLAGFDEDIRIELAAAMRESGIELLTGRAPRSIVQKGKRVCLCVSDAGGGQGEMAIETDKVVVFAIGRRPNTEGLGLAEVGVELGAKGEVIADDDAHTSVENIFAVGDVTGRAELTPVAIQAARAWADRTFGGKPTLMSYEGIPTAVFSAPPIGSVGLSEEQARAKHGADGVRVYKSRFNPLIHTLTERKIATFVKLIVREADDRVIGAHIIGHDAAEIIQGFAVALKAGATKADFDATVGIHPSTAEEFVTMS